MNDINDLPRISRPTLAPFVILVMVAIGLLVTGNLLAAFLAGAAGHMAARYWRAYWLMLGVWKHQNGECDCNSHG